MKLCTACLNNAFRLGALVDIVSDDQLRDPKYLLDMRAFTSGLGVPADIWPDFLCDHYRDFKDFIRDTEGNIISLNTELLETYREWYRDWVNTPVKPGVIPRLRIEARPRVRVMATILKTAFPAQEENWGSKGDNDNARLHLVK